MKQAKVVSANATSGPSALKDACSTGCAQGAILSHEIVGTAGESIRHYQLQVCPRSISGLGPGIDAAQLETTGAKPTWH